MQFSWKRMLSTSLASLLAVGFTAAPALAEPVSQEPSDSDVSRVTDQWEIGPDATRSVNDSATEISPMQQIGPFVMIADNPHFSQGDVSAHGCFTGGPVGGAGIVYNSLEYQASDGRWVYVTTGNSVTVPQGCGRGKRSVARAGCRTFERTLWRNTVDVDIVGAIDSPLKARKEAWVNCSI